MKVDLSALARKWPSAYVSRSEVPRFSGGIISDRYIANLDCQGMGPPGRIKVGRRVAYPVDSLVRWLESRSTDQNE